MRAEERDNDNQVCVEVGGRRWTLLRPSDLEALWENITDDQFAEDERVPYWVELWPSSLTLTQWLGENAGRISGKICLDLGCGLGLTAMAAQKAGARVVAMDYEIQALEYAARNAAVNRVDQPLWTAMDWRQPALRAGSFDFIWGGDIMYEKRFVMPVLDCIEHALNPDGTVWIAEPGRNIYGLFRQSLEIRGWSSRPVFRQQVAPLHDQTRPVPVNLWEIRKKKL